MIAQLPPRRRGQFQPGNEFARLGGQARAAKLSKRRRREIALCVISQLAVDGQLTMTDFAANKPSFMPTPDAISKMFGTRWSSVVKNAVSTGAVAA